MTKRQDLYQLAEYAVGDKSLYDMLLELKVDSTRVELRRHAKEHISMVAYRVLYGKKQCNQYISDVLEEIL
jgi:hypothetical protein